MKTHCCGGFYVRVFYAGHAQQPGTRRHRKQHRRFDRNFTVFCRKMTVWVLTIVGLSMICYRIRKLLFGLYELWRDRQETSGQAGAVVVFSAVNGRLIFKCKRNGQLRKIRCIFGGCGLSVVPRVYGFDGYRRLWSCRCAAACMVWKYPSHGYRRLNFPLCRACVAWWVCAVSRTVRSAPLTVRVLNYSTGLSVRHFFFPTVTHLL